MWCTPAHGWQTMLHGSDRRRRGCARPLPAALAGLLAAIGAGPAPADTLYVPTQYPAIQLAIDASTDGDLILVAPGLYLEAIDLLGKAITIQCSEPGEVAKVDGSGIGGSVVTCAGGEDADTVLHGLTFVGGDAFEGGGLYCTASPTLIDCTFQDNHANSGGGAYYTDTAAPTFIGCTFVNNTATDWGGAVAGNGEPLFDNCAITTCDATRCGGLLCDGGAVTMIECAITGNTGLDYYGGGILLLDGADLVAIGCQFTQNASLNGGALCNWGGDLTITGCTFANNTALEGGWSGAGGGVYHCGVATFDNCLFTANIASAEYDPGYHGGAGGGVFLESGASTSLIQCTFLDNVAEDLGGGLYNSDGETTLQQCIFAGNAAEKFGGGIYAEKSAGPEQALSMVGCSFLGNDALSSGGAIYVYSDGLSAVNCLLSGNTTGSHGAGVYTHYGSVQLTNCTIGNNLAEYDYGTGGLYATESFADTPILANCILWSNWPGQIGGKEADVRYSCIEDGYPGEGNIELDPAFVDADGPDGIPGTQDDDLRLAPGSPCIDAGDSTAVPEDIVADLDGNPRFVDDPDTDDTGLGAPPIVDMGAYEYQPPECPADITGDGVVDVLDLLEVLAQWGTAGSADITGDGIVDVLDLLEVLGAWGPCG